MQIFKKYPFYLLLFAMFPALSLISHNISEDHFGVVIRPVYVSLIITIFFFLLTNLFIKNISRSGLFTLFVITIFFSFGHAITILSNTTILGVEVGRIRVLGIISIITLLIGFLIIKKIPNNFSDVNLNLFMVSLLLVLIPIGNILYFNFQQIEHRTTRVPLNENKDINNSLPDVYFIILDSYTRQDVLEELYNYDNQPFLNTLKNLGFYIAECSMSNYQYTLLSMSSTLNMNYLPDIDKRINKDQYQPEVLKDLIRHNKVRKLLSDAGYKFVSVENSYLGTQIPDADIYIRQSTNNYFNSSANEYLTPFEEMFIKTTVGVALYRLPLGDVTKWVQRESFPYYDRARNQLFQLDTLSDLVYVPGPKFVYVHLNIPHRPFIFQADGSIQNDPGYYSNDGGAINQEYENKGYTDQIDFINNRLPTIINHIITNSKNQPIIIIQGDHGLDTKNRSLILNSFYPAERLKNHLYPSISSVNTFRVVLNSILNTSFEILPDISMSSPGQERFDFSEISDPNPMCSR